jgi:hypothetical protein
MAEKENHGAKMSEKIRIIILDKISIPKKSTTKGLWNMAKQIIIMTKHAEFAQYRVAYWVPVPVERQPFYVSPTKVSEWKGASSLENQDLQTGAVVEIVETVSVPEGASVAEMQAVVLDRYNVLVAEITTKNQWGRYGTYYDGSSWTLGGVS